MTSSTRVIPLCAVSVLCSLAPAAAAQFGTVDSQQKVSSTVGGLTGPLDNVDQFGASTAALGDLDGDFVADVAVGATQDDDGGTNRGAVWVLFLNSDGTVKAEQKISDTAGGFTGVLDDGDQFGAAVASPGDLDGDLVADLAVGAGQDDDGGTNRGAVWILFLNANGTVKGSQKISSTAGGFGGALDDGDQFGWSLAALGDLDGDGIEDLAAGAVGDDDGGSGRGAVWVLFLNADGTVKAEQKISALAGGFGGVLDNTDQFGSSTARLPDLDGDAVDDLAVGARLDDDGGADRGAVWVLFLNADGTVKAEQKISALAGGFTGALDDFDDFGFSAATLGDLDGDGLAELAVGAELDDDGGTNRGAVWVLFLDATGNVQSHQKLSSTSGGFGGALDNSDQFGCSLCAPGDLDGDGDFDALAGARLDDDGGTDRGAVWALFLEGVVLLPVADFSGTPTSGVRPLAVAFTDLSSGGTITSWSWTFGDGGTSSAQSPGHTYTLAGTYDVALTVTGPAGTDNETKLGYVVVTDPPPVADFSGAPTSGDRPLLVAFTDLSSSGTITSWAWTFGDGGTSSVANPSHTFTTAGTYDVSLTVTSSGGTDTETKTAYVVVSEPPPVAAFSGTPTRGTAPLAVAFTDSSTGVVTSWSWTFGDGGTSTAQHPSHVYLAAGLYTVGLTVSGPGGVDTETKIAYVRVKRPIHPAGTPPTSVLAPEGAEFFGRPLSGTAPLTVDFHEVARGPWGSFAWTFGDGGTSTQMNPTHTYGTPGVYTVSLVVSRQGGAVTDTETKVGYIVVTP